MNRIVSKKERVKEGALGILRNIGTATIYEAAGKLGDIGPPIRLLVEGATLAGIAFTVKAMPGDNRVVFKAIDEAPPGSVLMIDAGASQHVTIWGGTSTVACVAKGIVGCVTNASARDIEQIRKLRFPLYAAGVNVRGTTKHHPGWTGLPIALGGVPINTGDIVIGDADGVVIIPAEQVDTVAAAAVDRAAMEHEREERLRAGEPVSSVIEY